MEHLKNIAAGLLAFVSILALLALMIIFGVAGLELLDWLERNWPEGRAAVTAALVACAVLALAWGAGRSLRDKPANA